MKPSIHRLTTVLVVGVLLLSTVPVSVAAQGTPGSLLLNQHATKVGTITVDGERYQVYRYDNTLPYASGMSVFHDGEQVTSEARARAVLTALAQRRAAAKLGTEEIETLRTVREQARIIANATGSAAAALNDTTALNVSRQPAPRFSEFNGTATDLRPSLRTTERYARAVVSNTTALIELLEKRRNGTEVDPQRLYDRYATTLSTINRLSGQSYKVDELSEVATLSDRIAANVSTSSDRGKEIAAGFEAVSSETARAANRTTAAFETLEEVAGYGTPLGEAQSFAQSQQSEWMDRWRTRQSAPMKIYGTLIGVPIALIVVGGYIRWRR